MNTSWPRLPAPTNCPAVTATPFSVSVPAPGSESIRTAAIDWPASASANPKSAALNVRVVSSAIVTASSVPVGGVLAPTLTVTVAVPTPPWPSETVYEIITGPLKLVAGVKVSVPSGFTVSTPCVGFVSTAPVSVIGSPSASWSFASTAIVTGTFTGVEARSFTASGGSFTGVTASVSVEVLVNEPSLSV